MKDMAQRVEEIEGLITNR